ncbi:MAG TPA: tetratricopeptide repeat protein [Kofleriaceae bacterium]
MKTFAVTVALCAVAFADPPKKPDKLTRDQAKAMRSHMKAGWAAQHEKRWADATKEFEAALKVLDGDARALSELGWSAMNAGDFAKAKLADEAAVRAAVDPKVEAASLYNLGLVQERLGDTLGALRSLTRSVALRPNKTVGDELAKLGGKPDAPPPFCGKDEKICDCLASEFFGEIATCEADAQAKPPVASWQVFAVKGTRDSEATYLVDEHRNLVTQLAGTYWHGANTESQEVGKQEVRTVGGHKIVWIETKSEEASQTMDENLVTDFSTTITIATVCAVGDKKTPTKCFQAPKQLSSQAMKSKMDDAGTMTDVGTTEDVSTLDWKLADDGVLTVKLVKGKFTGYAQDLLGPHKLW